MQLYQDNIFLYLNLTVFQYWNGHWFSVAFRHICRFAALRRDHFVNRSKMEGLSGCLFVSLLPFELSGMGRPTISYDTVGTTLRVIWSIQACWSWQCEQSNKSRQYMWGLYIDAFVASQMLELNLESWITKDQLDVTCYFISLLMCSTCFGH